MDRRWRRPTRPGPRTHLRAHPGAGRGAAWRCAEVPPPGRAGRVQRQGPLPDHRAASHAGWPPLQDRSSGVPTTATAPSIPADIEEPAMTALTVETVAIDELRPDPANPRRITRRRAGGPDPLDAPVGHRPAGARPTRGLGRHRRPPAARRGTTGGPDRGAGHLARHHHGAGAPAQPRPQPHLGLLGRAAAGPPARRPRARCPTSTCRCRASATTRSTELLRKLAAAEKADRTEDFDVERALDGGGAGATRPGPVTCGCSASTGCSAAMRPTPRHVARLLDGAEPGCCRPTRPMACPSTPAGATGCTTRWDAAYVLLRTRGHRNTTISGDTRVDWTEAFALAVTRIRSATSGTAASMPRRCAQGLVSIGFEIGARSSGTRDGVRHGQELVSLGTTSPAGWP